MAYNQSLPKLPKSCYKMKYFHKKCNIVSFYSVTVAIWDYFDIFDGNIWNITPIKKVNPFMVS